MKNLEVISKRNLGQSYRMNSTDLFVKKKIKYFDAPGTPSGKNFEKSSWKNQICRTGFKAYLQKLISKLIFAGYTGSKLQV